MNRIALFALALVGACSPQASQMDHVVMLPVGTGTVIAEGWVITAKHVADELPEGVEHIDHPDQDVSLVKWDTTGKTALEVAAQSPRVGERVLLVGFAAARTQVVSDGFSGIFLLYPQWGSLTAETAPGMSGGAVLHGGQLVGIYLGSFLVWSETGWIDSPPEQRYLRIEFFKEWLDESLVLGF